MSQDQAAALPYHEPGIVTILILTAFILLLNLINHVLDNIINCGLLGQIFLGIAWGTPGARWLGLEVEHVVVDLGYLGLLLLVYEGGLTTSFSSLKANLVLSLCVALTGICLPVALSYVLMRLNDATPIQAFAAGAALCSTSLGTTFTVMGTSGLTTTRMGVVLTSAAMMDDVVGLVMVQVISNLGVSSTSFDAATLIRPIFVSLAFVTVVPLVAVYVAKPITIWLNSIRAARPTTTWNQILQRQETALLVHTGILLFLVTSSTYAGTSNLFAAYLSGAAISWWDSAVPHHNPSSTESHVADGQQPNRTQHLPQSKDSGQRLQRTESSSVRNAAIQARRTSNESQDVPRQLPVASKQATSGMNIFELYYSQPLQRILKPFFFASIGFAVPITLMFTGSVLWRGVVYTVLMMLSKMACGLWLVSFSSPRILISKSQFKKLPAMLLGRSGKLSSQTQENIMTSMNPIQESTSVKQKSSSQQETLSCEANSMPLNKNNSQEQPTTNRSNQSRKITDNPMSMGSLVAKAQTLSRETSKPAKETLRKPRSLYPATIVGSAMVARGEIGFLISSIAQSNGIFGPPEVYSVMFLTVTWAIMLCTMIGPISVGLIVKRVRRLQGEARGGRSGDVDQDAVLGAWGVT